jgi:hypothetical protein
LLEKQFLHSFQTEDVAPSLVWGRDNIALLESQLAELRRNQSIGNAIPLARKYLPTQNSGDPLALTPKLYVVMGERAGAAAIDDQLYFDVLITAWRASRGAVAPATPDDVIEFFAHETHHLGYGQILDHKRASLKLTPAEAQVWDFLVATMMEGSATLLINGHEHLADLEKQPDVRRHIEKVAELLPSMESVLRSALKGPMTEEAYAEATSPFLDMGYHATGAKLLSVICDKRGLTGVLDVMSDPRQLLTAYNDSTSTSLEFRFDPQLASRISHLGEPQ